MVDMVASKKTRLNANKIAFINAYTQLGAETFHNGARSARMAGYKDSNASDTANNLLKDPLVSEEIARRDKLQWDWDFETWSQEVLKSAAEVTASHANRPRYLEMIGKSKGFISDRASVTNNMYILNGDDIESIRQKIVGKLGNNHIQSSQAIEASYNVIEVKAESAPNSNDTKGLAQ
jgi:hypothetical protein